MVLLIFFIFCKKITLTIFNSIRKNLSLDTNKVELREVNLNFRFLSTLLIETY